MSTDKDFYVNLKIDNEMASGHVLYLMPYLDAISRRMTWEDNVLPALEVGIGTGLCSIYLEQYKDLKVLLVDNERDIIDKFKNVTKPFMCSNAMVGHADAFDLLDIPRRIGSNIGLIHHQGLLEHFEDEDVYKMLKHHTKMSQSYVIFAIPIVGHEDSEYDPDEVRKSFDWWLSFLNGNDFIVFECGMFGMDNSTDQAYFVIKDKEDM